MKIGDTFLREDSDRHLWIVLSDPEKDADAVLLVNLTTWTAQRESACILHAGDHPWITHKTCVNYDDIDTLPDLQNAKDGGAFKLQKPLSKAVLRKILDGAANSIRLSLEKAEILEQQGLIDI